MSQPNEPFDPYYQWLGIPPEEQPPNHYRLLGIRLFEENREVIQHAGDRQMAHLRSFQNGPRAAESQKLLNEVAAAKLCLLSPDRKAAYDATLVEAGPDASVAVPPPVGPDLPAPSPEGIRFANAAGTLAADPAFRAARISRPRRRRRSLLPWLLTLIAGTVVALAAWSWWRDRLPSERLILEWPAATREHATLRINGRLQDLAWDPIARDAQELAFALPPGTHHVQIERPGFEPINQSIELSGGTPARLEVAFVAGAGTEPDPQSARSASTVGRVVLQWPLAARADAKLEIDDRTVNLTRPGYIDSPETVEIAVKAGAHTLHIELADGLVVDRSFTVAGGERWELAVTTDPVRVVFRWPEADRQDARLELNGRVRDLVADPVAVDAEQVVFEVQPGRYTVRIARPGFDDFRTVLTDVREERQIEVTWVAAAHVRPGPAELEELREAFRRKYEKSEQYEKWAAEQDPARKSELLKYLVARLESDAESLPEQSAQLWAACDEMLNLALDGEQFVLAQNLLTGTVGGALLSDSERQAWEDRIWDAALKSTHLDDLTDFLRLRKAAGRLPTEQEQAVIARRLSEAVDGRAGQAAVVARIQMLEDEAILGRAAATQARAAAYLAAAGQEPATPAGILDLCDQMLALIPYVFESGQDDAVRQVNKLADAVTDLLRRRSLREARTVDQSRQRIRKAEEGVKLAREWVSQFPRVQAARTQAADGQATAAEHKLIAFWLLQLGHYSAALPHLLNTEDKSLVHIGQAPPDTAKGLATLADDVELEARKSKYTRRQADALRGFVRHLRQNALDKNDTSLQPAERVELRNKLGE